MVVDSLEEGDEAGAEEHGAEEEVGEEGRQHGPAQGGHVPQPHEAGPRQHVACTA